ncbi:kinase-like domain-containing protein [Crepidotus variabilis]|uniref:Kinase-like domain-containing protein n=1 Tax=Crepidotus variabilis TaxID=179855 RepID=A0A9P6ENG6_9AGAR|nr:kinase-like domain-containing protein [Crepidotus variabilis]
MSSTTPATTYDPSSILGVREYLRNSPYDCTDIEELSGGTANYVFRLKLIQPFEGRETLVLKHAKPFVKDHKDFAFGLDRQKYEVAALRQVRAWLPVDSIVTVPEVHRFDEEAHAIIMDDAGAGSLPLKEFMQKGKVTTTSAAQIGAALGLFLGELHKWGKGNETACEAVRENQQAKNISSYIFYGRMRQTLTGAQVPLLSEPPLGIEESDLQVLDEIAKETQQTMLAASDEFIMGDFWPGNIMISLDGTGDLRQIFILDWELVKTGLPSADIGQFSAEIHLLRRFHPDACGETSTILLKSFLQEYKRVGKPTDEIMRRATVQVGAHLIDLTARVKWGEKELTRTVVREGVRMLVDGSDVLEFS